MWNYMVNGKNMGLIRVPFSKLCVGQSECALTFDTIQDTPRTFLCFEGITYRAEVELNGEKLGTMVPYSFYSFDVSGVIKPRNNRLTVRLWDMNLPFGPSEGWENYGGIIRDVFLMGTDDLMIEDVIWRTTFGEDYESAEGEVKVLLNGGDGCVSAVLKDRMGFEVASESAYSESGHVTITLPLKHPNLWSPDMPYLYTLTVSAGEDEIIQKVGFKDFRVQGQRFILNGKPLFLKGVCRHDMWGDQGHTLTDEQMKKDLRMIKSTGCNFVRLVHYPHHRHIIELADEIGLMVSEEPGLWWSDMHNPETTSGALQVMERIVKRDRNHISVAFWLCFNECRFTPEFLQESSAICKELDPTRPVSGANCMDIEMTKELFIKNGFDFYTMHPYGVELNSVHGGVNGHTSLDIILETLNDKPLLFTEWGGLYVFENPKLFARFQRYMLDAWKNPDGGRVLAGSCYWVWADMYEFGRGEHACFDGILNEGLVDIYRNPRVNLDVFAKLMNGAELEKDIQMGQTISPFTMDHPEELTPVDVWEGQDQRAQAEAYRQMLEKSTPQEGYEHKKLRRLSHGPALPDDYALLGNLPVNLRKGQPLVIRDELVLPVGTKAGAVYFLGNVSMPWGYPAYGEVGDEAGQYILEYEDGSRKEIPLRNGIEITTALASVGPSRIDPIARKATPAIRYHYDLNWEHYIIQLFETRSATESPLKQIRIQVTDQRYTLLLYGVTIRK